MKAEMIEKLQENEKPMCFMDKELREFMFGIKFSNFNCLQCSSKMNEPEWSQMKEGQWTELDYGDCVFQLRSDYQPEPEVIRCEVVVEDGYICYRQGKDIFPFIDTVLRNPKWIGSEDKNGVFLGEVIRLRPPFEDCDTKSLTKPAEWVKYVLFAKGD